ncbi:MAG: polyprotein (domains: methyltransferase - helicase - caspase/glycosyltransferase - RNA-dependent RNA polymerase) [Plant associated alphaendornavirus 1]|nr:MAG: polyprotein (domains: methyltransferase - helicase - caspase/glycosyltransferase - RNA-dependent RNA polymerase) [Plant associated alphaendornavirus 1]
MACLLDIKVLSRISGGLHPHSSGRRGRNLTPVSNQKLHKNDSIRKMFRGSKHVIKTNYNTEAIPAVMSCHKREHDQFIQAGADMCVPDLSHLDERAFRNFFMLYMEDHCHMDMTKENASELFKSADLQNSEPNLGTRAYWTTMRPEVIPAVKDDGTRDPVALKFMMDLIKQKFGGSLRSMCTMNFKLNPNLTPHIYRRCGKYGYKAGEMASPHGIKQCAQCGTCNFIWLPHHEDKLSNQHCGMCFFSLDLKHMNNEWFIPNIMVEDINQLHVGALQKDMSELMNQLDGAEEFSTQTTNKLVEQDLKNVRAIMSRRMFRTIKVNNGMTTQQLNYLKNHNLSFHLVQSRSTPNPHAMLSAERKIIWYSFAEKLGHDRTLLDVGTRKLRDNSLEQRWRGMGPIVDWRDAERYSAIGLPNNCCTHTVNTCDCLVQKRPLIIAVDSIYDIAPGDIIRLMRRCESNNLLYSMTTAAVDFEAVRGDLYFDQGQWSRDADKLLTVLKQDDRPYENNWHLTKLWATADVITDGEWSLQINTYNVVGNHIMRSATLTKSKLEKMKYKEADQIKAHIRLNVPIVQCDSYLNNQFVPVIAYENRTIDVNLFKALYSRNLTANLSFDKMVEFGLAYAHTKYTTPTRMVSYQHVTADDVRLHVLLATVHSRRKMFWVQETELMNDPKSVHGVSMTGSSWTVVVEYLLKLVLEYGTKQLSRFGQLELASKVHSKLQPWLEDPFWDLLDQLWDANHKTGLIQFDVSDIESLESVQGQAVCNHHNMTCSHAVPGEQVCACCGIASVEKNDLCFCCNTFKCEHRCNHKCVDPSEHMRGNEKIKICCCCGIEFNTTHCVPCVINPGKQPNRQEPPNPRVKRTQFKVFPTDILPTNQTLDSTEPPQLHPTKRMRTQRKWKPRIVATPDPADPNNVSDTEIPEDFVFNHQTKRITLYDGWLKDMYGDELGSEAKTVANLKGENGSIKTSQAESVELSNAPANNLSAAERNAPGLEDEEMTDDDIAAIKLMSITSHAYVMVVINGLHVAVSQGLVAPMDFNPENRVGISQLRYHKFGTSWVDTDNFVIEQTAEVPGDGLCGFHAIKYVLGDEANLPEMRHLTGVKDWWSDEELANYLRHLGYNSLLLLPARSLVTVVNGMDDRFVCIVHGTIKKTNYMHWEPANVLQVDTKGMMPCWQGMWTITQENKMISSVSEYQLIDDLDERERIDLAILLIEKHRIKHTNHKGQQSNIVVKVIEGKNYLNNNGANVMMPRAGLFHFEIPETWKSAIELTNSPLHGKSADDLMGRVFDVPPLYNADVPSALASLVAENCAYLNSIWLQASGRLKVENSMWTKSVQRTKMINTGKRRFPLGSTKLKTGDLIMLELDTTTIPVYVTVQKDEVCFTPPMEMSQSLVTCRINVPKSSYKSRLLQVWFASKAQTNQTKLLKLLENSHVTYGPAGSGKTTTMIKNLKAGDVVVARTKVAVETIKAKLHNSSVRVLTYEQFCVQSPKASRVYIDECTMFTWLDVALMCTEDLLELHMFGDPHQVGTIDTGILSGTRDISAAGEYSKNIEHLNKTYRYGRTLCEYLNRAGIEVESAADHDTEVKWFVVDELNDEVFRQAVTTSKPDVILTFYNRVREKLSKLTTIPVVTVHSYQSKEADSVLVIHCAEQRVTSKIWLNRQYCLSAITRCKRRVVWISVGLPHSTQLHDILRGDRLETTAIGSHTPDMIVSEMVSNWQNVSNDIDDGDCIVVSGSPQPSTGGADGHYRMNGKLTNSVIAELAKPFKHNVLANWTHNTVGDMAVMARAELPSNVKVEVHGRVITIDCFGTITLEVSRDNAYCSVSYSNFVLARTAKPVILKGYQDEVVNKLTEVMSSGGETDWFAQLPISLQTELFTNYGNELAIHKVEEQSEDRFYDCATDFPEEANVFRSPKETFDEFCVLKLAHILMDDHVKEMVETTIGRLSVGMTKHVTDQGEVVTLLSKNKVLLKYWVVNAGLELKLVMAECQPHLVKNLTRLVNAWNDIVLEALGQSNLWYTLKSEHKRHIAENFRQVVRVESMQFMSPTVLNERFKQLIAEEGIEGMEAMNSESVEQLLVNIRAHPASYPEAVELTNMHNSHNSLCLCGDHQAWWNNAEREPEFMYDVVWPSSRSTTLIRLLAENIQLYETCGAPCFITICQTMIGLETFGGCSLCCGIAFIADGVVFLKLSPRKTIVDKRMLLIRQNHLQNEACLVLSALEITDCQIFNYVDAVMPAGLAEQWLHDIIRLPGYELGMLLERISIVPAAMIAKLKHPVSKRLCMQSDNDNKEYLSEIKHQLRPEWSLTSVNKISGHVSARYGLVSIEKENFMAYCWWNDSKLYVTSPHVGMHPENTIVLQLHELVAKLLSHRINRWQWRIAMRCKLSRNTQPIGFGSDEGAKSLNLPLSYHRANKTAVFEHFRQRVESEKLSSMIKSHHIVFVHSKQLERYGHLLRHECANLPVEVQSYDLMERGFDQLVETIGVKYVYNGLDYHGRMTVATVYPYLSMSTSSWGAYCHPLIERNVTRYMRNVLDCNPILAKMNMVFSKADLGPKDKVSSEYYEDMAASITHQMTSKVGPWFTEEECNPPARSTHLYLGLHMLASSPTELVTIIANQKTNVAIVLCPLLFNSNNMLFKMVSETEYTYEVAYDGSPDTITVNKKSLDMMLNGAMQTVGNKVLMSHSTSIILGHAVCRLILCDSNTPAPNYCCPQMQYAVSRKVVFTMPRINDIRRALSECKLVETKKVEIDSKFYRALSLRMLRPNTSFTDLLAYARTYIHAVTYSNAAEISINSRYDTDMMEACLCVFYESTRANESMEMITELLTNSYRPATNWNNVKTSVVNLMRTQLGSLLSPLRPETKVDELLELIALLLDRSEIAAIKQLKVLTIHKIKRPSEQKRIIKRTDNTLVQANLTEILKNAGDMFTNSINLVAAGTNRWWRLSREGFHDSTLKTSVKTESDISTACRFLETCEGLPLRQAVASLLNANVLRGDLTSIERVVKQVLQDVADPVSLNPVRKAHTQLVEDLGMPDSLKLMQPDVSQDVVVSMEEMKRRVVKLKWMYPTQSMKLVGKTIVFSSIGSMGDVEPFLSIAVWLREMGAHCKLLVPENFVKHVTLAGFDALGLPVDSEKIIKNCIDFEKTGNNLLQKVNVLMELFKMTSAVFSVDTERYLNFIKGADLLLETPFTHIGSQLAQKMNVPFMLCAAYPWEYSNGYNVKGEKQGLLDFISGALTYAPFIQELTDWRKLHLGLETTAGTLVSAGGTPMLYLHPKETTNWKISVKSNEIGYCEKPLLALSQLELETLSWVQTKPTAAVCFGSMVIEDYQSLLNLVMHRIPPGIKQVIVVGYKGLPFKLGHNKAAEIKFIEFINYHALFSVTSMVVTHGGSGTVHNALRHANCVLVNPFFGDQHAWSEMLRKNDAGWGIHDSNLNLKDGHWISNEQFLRKKKAARKIAEEINQSSPMANVVSNICNILEIAETNTANMIENRYWHGAILPIYNHEKITTLKLVSRNWRELAEADSLAEELMANWASQEQSKFLINQNTNLDTSNHSSGFSSTEGSGKSDDIVDGENNHLNITTTSWDDEAHQSGSNETKSSAVAIEVKTREKVTDDSVNPIKKRRGFTGKLVPNPVLKPPQPSRNEPITTHPSVDLKADCLCEHAADESHIDHLWSFSDVGSKLNIAVPSTRMSIHRLMSAKEVRTVLDPQNDGECVFDCLKALLRAHHVPDVVAEPQIVEIRRMFCAGIMPNFNEVIGMMTLLGLSVVLSNSVTNVVISHECGQPCQFKLSITYNAGIGHCKLIEVQDVELGPVITTKTMRFTSLKKQIQQSLGIIVSDYQVYKTDLVCKQTRNQTLLYESLHVDIDNTRARMKLDKLVFTMRRHVQRCYHVSLCTDGEIYYTLSNIQVNTGQMVLIQCSDTYVASLAVQVGNGLALIPLAPPKNMRATGTVVVTEIKFGGPIQPRSVTTLIRLNDVDVHTYTNLNVITRDFVMTRTNLVGCNTVANESATKLLIYDHDGRAHHNYDERNILMRFQPTNIVGVGFDYTGDMHHALTCRDTKWRLSVVNGCPTITMEFYDTHKTLGTQTLLHAIGLSPVKVSNQLTVPYSSVTRERMSLLNHIADNLGLAEGLCTARVDGKYSQWVPITQDVLKEFLVDGDALSHLLGERYDRFDIRLRTTQLTHVGEEVNPTYVTCVVWSKNTLGFSKACLNFDYRLRVVVGGDDLEERVLWKLPTHFQASKHSRWWDQITDMPESNFTREKWENALTTEALSDVFSSLQMGEERQPQVDGNETFGDSFFVPSTEWHVTPQEWKYSVEIPTCDDICLWEDIDLSDWNEKFAPINEATVTSRVPPTALTTSTKSTLVEYPKYARPVLTKCANQEFNAATGRLCKVVKYRKYNYQMDFEWNQFVATYFDKAKLHLLNLFQVDQLTFNDNKVLDWLSQRPDGNKIAAELEGILSSGMEVNPINNINVHLKLESLLKEEPAKSIKQVKARPLMWQCKGYCAVFSHCFKEVKQRLKQLLKHNIVYTDGLRADELAARVRAAGDFKYIFENDLAQQDKQTDMEIIEFEMYLYKKLGMNPGMVNLWKNCHRHWKYKSRTVMGVRDAMRLTGQATTALGNVITNMLVHRRITQQLQDSLRLFLLLGDDGLMLLDSWINVDHLNTELKHHHNMMCKPYISTKVGTFCCMLLTKNHLGISTLGPDFIRMKRRFEVTNGVSEPNDVNMQARAMSYAMMLGRTPEVAALIKRKGWKIEPMRWYDMDSIVSACASKYNVSVDSVWDNYHELIDLMGQQHVYQHNFLHWVEKL